MDLEANPRMQNPPAYRSTAEGDNAWVFSALREIARGIVALFPGFCEVVIHDLTDLEHSVVHIEGNITDRAVGSPMTDAGLRALRDGNVEQLLGYVTRTPGGKVLRCAAPFLKDDRGQYYAAMCINLDVSLLAALQSALRTVIPSAREEISEAFSSDAGDSLARMLQETAAVIGEPVSAMSRADRLRLVENLDREGAFQFRNAVPMIADFLGASRSTIYNYIKEVTTLSGRSQVDTTQSEANDHDLHAKN
jgi:predicted transcriptional regulator YheO